MNSSDDTTPGAVPVTVNGAPAGRISRRDALRWVMATTAAAAALPASGGFAQEVGRKTAPQEDAARQPDPVYPGGYGTDPRLMKFYKPGDVWPLTFTAEQHRTASALADVILPADDLGPAASAAGVVEMLDEWVSAPYPVQQADRPIVLDGLAWLDAESGERFGKPFADLSAEQHRAICDDIYFAETAKPALAKPAAFFARFRWLSAAAYYATPAGWRAIGYVGNEALASFDGPPPAVLERLGVTQTVEG